MSNLKVELIALADYALTAEDKKLSVMGIFDKIFLKAVPASHPRMSFVVTISGTAHSEETITMRIISPSKKEIFKADAKIRLGDNGKANMVSNFEGLPLSEAGVYKFVLDKKGKEFASHELTVLLVKDSSQGVAN